MIDEQEPRLTIHTSTPASYALATVSGSIHFGDYVLLADQLIQALATTRLALIVDMTA